MVKEIYDGIQLDKDLIFTTSTKTQYAGPYAHIALIKLLKYVAAKYLDDFILSDEGYYWETSDEKKLMNQFKNYYAAIDSFHKALESLPAAPDETPESLTDRLEKLLREKFGKEKE